MRLRSEQRAFTLLMLLALLVLGAGLGLRDPWPADEPRFALVARDMVERGEWLFPQVAGVLYPDKPPLFMWCIAAFYLLTGSLRIAFLLPSLIAALGTLWLVYDLGTRLWSRRIGFYAAAALLVSCQFALQAKSAQIDMLLCFWVTLGLYGLLRHMLLGPAWSWYAAGGAAMGLGVITKGVGFLPLFLFLPYAFARLRGWRLPSLPAADWRWSLAPLAFLAAIAAWLVPMLVAVAASGDPAFAAYRDNILFRQTAERYADAWHHIKPFWYYAVEVIPLFWLPLTALLPWLVPAWRRRLARGDARQLLLLGWTALVVVFFSLSPGKRGVYVLPALPAFALACAPLLPGLVRRAGVQRAGTAVLGLLVASLATVPVYYLFVRPDKASAFTAEFGLDIWLLLGTLAAIGLGWLVWGRLRRGLYALCGFLLSLWLVYGLLGYPLLDAERSYRELMTAAAAKLPPGSELGIVDWREQMMLQADRPVRHFGYRRGGRREELMDALRWLVTGRERRVMLPETAFHDCIHKAAAVPLAIRYGVHWYLIDTTALTDACRAHAIALGPPPPLSHMPATRSTAPD